MGSQQSNKEPFFKEGTWGYLLAEISFFILPFITLGLIYLFKGEFVKVFFVPEWSIVTSIIFGQTIVKFSFAGAIIRYSNKSRPYNLSAFIAVLIVLGLIPTVITLVLIIISENVSFWLMITQMLLFILSLFIFITFHGLTHEVIEANKMNK